jgi:hypothetical protein
MPTFKYKPYYQYDGPSFSHPFREELLPEEVNERLRCFFEDIAHYFDENITIKKEGDLISISGEIKQENCDETVKKCLNDLDLFAKKIP